jgi:hypothetical protein
VARSIFRGRRLAVVERRYVTAWKDMCGSKRRWSIYSAK